MTDYTVTITDQDALDAIAAEIHRITDAGGQTLKPADYLADFITTQHILLRRSQVIVTAQQAVTAAEQAFDDAQAAKQPKPQPLPPQPAPVQQTLSLQQ